MKKVFFYPQKKMVMVIPLVLMLGFIIGSMVDTSGLKKTILVGTIMMIYPSMIGLNLKELTSLKEKKLLITAMLVNFMVIPLFAYGIGLIILRDEPLLFTGLALASILPTSGMTISWTMINRGNVSAAVKITVFGLILGSVAAPWYLLIMVGEFVDIDVFATFKTIALVVFVPMMLGFLTHRMLLKKYSSSHFKEKIKPYFPAVSIWAMMYVVFVSISLKAEMLLNNLDLIMKSIIALLLFYFVSFVASTVISRKFFDMKNGVALVYGTVMRNLSIAIGIAATSFGSEAALFITIAFIIQQQGAVIYSRYLEKTGKRGDVRLNQKGA